MVQIIKRSSKLSHINLFIYLLNKDGKVARLWEAEGEREGERRVEGSEQKPWPDKKIK